MEWPGSRTEGEQKGDSKSSHGREPCSNVVGERMLELEYVVRQKASCPSRRWTGREPTSVKVAYGNLERLVSHTKV